MAKHGCGPGWVQFGRGPFYPRRALMARLKEAAKLGFAEAWVPLRASGREPPRRGKTGPGKPGDGLATVPIGHLAELVARLSPAPRRIGPAPSRRFAGAS